ncbi:MAG: hypothetical protein QOH70_2088 [Blastocatellia bacterium]|jgi:hypothetical protein|nr:hypothetical protein [Blastocatellia bacterium]
MSPGVKFEGEIQKELRNSKVCLFLLSKSFLASEYCQNEVGYAEAHGNRFLPCRLDDCKPAGFLASRNYLNLADTREMFERATLDDGTRGYLDYDEIMESMRRPSLVSMLECLIRRLRQEPLRAELIDFYERALCLAGSSDTSQMHFLQFRSRDGSSEHTKAQSREDFKAVVKSILAYLKDDKPLDGLPLGSSMERAINFEFLPAWRLRSSSLAQINAHTQFQALPDCYIQYRLIHEQGNMIEASVLVLLESDRPPNGQHLDESELGYLTTLSPATTYGGHTAEGLMKLGWGCQDIGQEELLLIPLKGIYRVARVIRGDRDCISVAFTKYIGLEATRAKLGFGFSKSEWKTSRANAFDEQDIVPRSALEMMYLGEDVTADRRNGISFLLFNNHKSIAIVQSMKLVIHRISPIPSQSGDGIPYGIFKEYRYRVTLPTKESSVRVTEDRFKYSPGEVDKFTIQLDERERGYSYEFSLVIEWMDISEGRVMIIETPREVARFPRYGG